MKKGDEIVHEQKGAHGTVVRTNPNGTVDVLWKFTKSIGVVSANEIVRLNK